MGNRIALGDDGVRFPWRPELMLVRKNDDGTGRTFREVMEGDETLANARQKAGMLKDYLKYLNTDLERPLELDLQKPDSIAGQDIRWLREELTETNARITQMVKEQGDDKPAQPAGDKLTPERLGHMSKREIAAYAKKHFNKDIPDAHLTKMRGDLWELVSPAPKAVHEAMRMAEAEFKRNNPQKFTPDASKAAS